MKKIAVNCVLLVLCNYLVTFSIQAKDLLPSCKNIANKPVVTFIVPDFENSPFWEKLGKQTIKASKALNIDLRFHEIPNQNRSRFNYAKKIEQRLIANPDTNYLVAPFLVGAEKRIMALIEKYQVKFISYNAPLSQSVQNAIGKPRQLHPLWIAHISPDDKQAGYDLTQLLLTSKSQPTDKKKLKMVAINGGRHSAVAQIRRQGLQQSILENTQIELLQEVETDWSYQQAADKTKQLFQRYPTIEAIWAASDNIAIAAITQWQQLNKHNKAMPIIVGIDWSEEVSAYIKNDQIIASLGGHIFEGVWLLALIKDHFHGLDFYPETSAVINYRMRAIDKSNIDLLNNIHTADYDFRKLSKCLSDSSKPYSFDAISLIKQ